MCSLHRIVHNQPITKNGTWYCPQCGLETFEGCQGERSLKQKNPISSHRRPIENNLSQIYPAFENVPLNCPCQKHLVSVGFPKRERGFVFCICKSTSIVNLLTHRQRRLVSAIRKIFGSCVSLCRQPIPIPLILVQINWMK